MLVRDEFTCVYCGAQPESFYRQGPTQRMARLHVDHIIPRCLGGADLLENLATACASCNLKKGPRLWPVPIVYCVGWCGTFVRDPDEDMVTIELAVAKAPMYLCRSCYTPTWAEAT